MKISRLDYVNIREIWQQEAADFTTWLADNIDYLNDKLGFNLNVLETEKKVGSFNVDIFCEDEHGNSVIIENQLERTDHKKDEIEQAIGNKINWGRMDNQISSTIEFDIDCCGLNDESTWKKGYEVIADTLVKWEDTFRPYLSEIRKNYRTFEIIQQ